MGLELILFVVVVVMFVIFVGVFIYFDIELDKLHQENKALQIQLRKKADERINRNSWGSDFGSARDRAV